MMKNNRRNSIQWYSLLIIIILVIFTACTSRKNEHVTDYFYLQIYDSEDQIVSKYKITLIGTISDRSSQIISVRCSNVFGDPCQVEYTIDNTTAYITITHPVEGSLMRTFTLEANGTFTGH